MQPWKKKLISIGFCLVFFISGCTDIQVKEERKAETDIGANEKISFILDRSSIKDVEDAQRIEEKLEICLDKALKKLDPPVQTISAKSFRNIVFPDMDYLSVPSSPESIQILLKTSEFKNRIKTLGLRYLLILHGESSTSQVECGGEAGLVICIWDKKTKLSASIIDLVKGFDAGEVKTEAAGKNWIVYYGFH